MASAAALQSASRATTKSYGNSLWSIAPTVQPSGSSQILRKCLPSTFMTYPSTRYNLIQLRLNQIVAVSFCLSMVFSENRFPLFRTMLQISRAQNPPRYRIELLQQLRIARLRRGDQRGIERTVPADRTRLALPGKIPGQPRH